MSQTDVLLPQWHLTPLACDCTIFQLPFLLLQGLINKLTFELTGSVLCIRTPWLMYFSETHLFSTSLSGSEQCFSSFLTTIHLKPFVNTFLKQIRCRYSASFLCTFARTHRSDCLMTGERGNRSYVWALMMTSGIIMQ